MPRVAVWNSGDRWNDPLLVWGPLRPPENHIMTPDNTIAMDIDPAVKTTFFAKLAEAAAVIAPYLSNVSADDKKHYASIGDKRAGMDEVFLRSMADNPGLVPSYVKMSDVNQDRRFRIGIKDMVAPLEALVNGLTDSALLASHDNFLAYTAYYNNVQMAAERNSPGATAELAKLSLFFPSGRRTKTTPAPTK